MPLIGIVPLKKGRTLVIFSGLRMDINLTHQMETGGSEAL